MDLPNLFSQYLFKEKQVSKATHINYLSDLRRFITWFAKTYSRELDPSLFSLQILQHYISSLDSQTSGGQIRLNSKKRYISTIRKFSNFLLETGFISNNPFDQLLVEKERPQDLWLLNRFSDYLLETRKSHHTINNYINDLRQFLDWLSKISPTVMAKNQTMLQLLNNQALFAYRERLLEEKVLTASSINRKLSSIRQYISWLARTHPNKIDPALALSVAKATRSENEKIHTVEDKDRLKDFSDSLHQERDVETVDRTYSSFPPVRMAQKILGLLDRSFEATVVEPITKSIDTIDLSLVKHQQKDLFVRLNEAEKKQKTKPENFIKNVSKEFYAPLSLSLEAYSLPKKIFHYIRHFRPEWYKRYHKSPLVHHVHLGILMIAVATYVYFFFGDSLFNIKQQGSVAGTASATRQLVFQGRLTDSQNLPIRTEKQVRFSLYNDNEASGLAKLWEEINNVKPDINGYFSISLGSISPIPQVLFTDSEKIFLGIAIGNDSELKPRQQLANVSLSENSSHLQGQSVITDPASGTKNVILALDSSGDLTIGGVASPTFTALGGIFSLSGQQLLLTTNQGSNGNILLSPDGAGILDIHKPIQNTSEYTNTASLSGAVEIQDVLSITTAESSNSALYINQNGQGNLISASVSGTAKFNVDNLGAGFFADDLFINGNDLFTSSTTFNLINTGALNLNIGNSASELTLGAKTGRATINNAKVELLGLLDVNGTGTHDIAGTLNLSGNTLTSSGDLTINPAGGKLLLADTDVFLVGGVGSLSYNAIADSGSLSSHLLSSDNDLYIEGNLEVDSDVFFDKNLAIGLTTTPQFRLDLLDSQSATAAAQIFNNNTSTDADGLIIKLGNNSSSVANTNRFLSFETSGLGIVGEIHGDATGVTYQTWGTADFAEHLKKDPANQIPYGSLICQSDTENVQMCQNTTTSILGVASEHPAFLGGKDLGEASIPVGLVGQVLTRVSNENGPIKQGDLLTSSSTAGVAAKAIDKGFVVGTALESFNGDQNGSIMIIVNPSWYDPTINLSANGNLNSQLTNNSQNTTLLGGWIEGVFQSIESSILSTKELMVEGTSVFRDRLQASLISASLISTDSLIVAGKTIDQHIQDALGRYGLHEDNITSPVISTETLRARLISPLDSSDGLELKLSNDRISLNTASEEGLIVLDSTGNADFAGNIKAHDASLSGNLDSNSLTATDATISGTLRAKKIIASEIEGLPISSSSATYVTNITNIFTNQQATPEATLHTGEDNDSQTISSVSATVPEDYYPIPESLLLAQDQEDSLQGIQDLLTAGSTPTLDLLTIEQGLVALGPSSFTDVSVASSLSVGSTLHLAENSINSLTGTLAIQSLGQGGVEFFSGLISMDTDGNLEVKGNAHFARNLTVDSQFFTSAITGLSDKDLTISLGSNSQLVHQTDSSSPALVVKNASGSGIFSLNQLGNIIASGSGQFVDIAASKFSIVRGAQADTSITETLASSSAGIATIKKGQRQRTIVTPFVTPASLIYLTATSDTQGITPYISRQTPEDIQVNSKGSFTIELPLLAAEDVSLNWWIVN